ncbi:MAG: hypothetical protein ACTHZ9_00085, partial [Leucobacter sp.]
ELYALAERVRELWEADDWVVTDISNVETGGPSTYFRADRDNGSLMSFEAAMLDGVGMFFLYIRAECSDHPTVMW